MSPCGRQSKVSAKRVSRLRRKPVVLVVEDDLDTRGLMKTAFSKEFRVLVAASAGEARNILARRSTLALILMDLALRGSEDGVMLTRWLRRHPKWKTTPIIATTAHATTKDRKAALGAGCDEYFAKPIAFEELRAAMLRLLRRRPA